MKALVLLLFALPAFAQDDCRGNHNCGGDDGSTPIDIDIATEVTGPTIGGDSVRSYGIGHSLGDVDINECLGSTQWGTPIFSKQKLVPNLWCRAETYDAKGMYDNAARMRCRIPDILSSYTSETECEREEEYHPLPLPIQSKPIVPTSGPPDMVMEQLAEQAEGQNLLEQRVARVETVNRISARKAQERRNYAILIIQKVRENDPEE